MNDPRSDARENGADERRNTAPNEIVAAIASFTLVWACELALARITSRIQSLTDVLLSGLFLILVPLGLILALRHTALPDGLRRSLVGLIATTPLVLVAGGIVGPIAYRFGGTLAGLTIGVALAIVLVSGMRRARLGEELFPSPGRVLGLLFVAVGLAWFYQPSGFPPFQIFLPFLVVSVILARFAAQPERLPIVALIGVALAFWPATPAPFPWPAQTEGPDTPDIILLSVDTLRADDAREMSACRQLAERGVRFEATQAGSSWTLPSMATLMTGQAASDHGAGRRDERSFRPIRADVATLAEQLAAVGYDTAAVVAPNPFVGSTFGFHRGFAIYHHFINRHRYALPRWLENNRAAGELEFEFAARPVIADMLTLFGWFAPAPFGSADEVAQVASRIMAERRERPLFLWLHFLDPHLPYRHAHETDLPGNLARTLATTSRDRILADPYWRSDDGIAALRTAYEHEIDQTDQSIMRLLQFLENDPAKRDQVIILTSDHGEEFFEHGGFEHGHALYEEVLSVPLVIAGLPEREAGAVVTTPVGLIDLAPTLLRIAGAESALPGQNLGGAIGQPVYVSENMLRGGAPDASYAARQAQWKLIVAPEGRRLFDLANDPDEARDLSRGHRAIVEELDPGPRVQQTEESDEVELSEAEKSRLRALGYLD